MTDLTFGQSKAERLDAILNRFFGGNKSKMARAMGKSQTAMFNALKRNTFDACALYDACGRELNPEWLLTGDGDMFKQKQPKQEPVQEHTPAAESQTDNRSILKGIVREVINDMITA